MPMQTHDDHSEILQQLTAQDRDLMIKMIRSISTRDADQMDKCVKLELMMLPDILDYLDDLQITFSQLTDDSINNALLVLRRPNGGHEIHVRLLRDDKKESDAVAVFVFNPSGPESRITLSYILTP